MRLLIAIFSLAILFTNQSVAQDILISEGGTVNVDCGGDVLVFVDAGADSSYAAGESFQMTFCPDGGNAISFIIDTETNGDIFNILPGDLLTVFDGPDTDSPILDVLNNTYVSSPVISLFATLDNPSGCLTFLFESSSSSVGSEGWTGQINCGNFWQPFDCSFVSTESEIDDFGYIDICQGEEITITADGIFPYSDGNGYNQTNENSYFEWDLGDGTLFEGYGLISVTNTYTEQFGYPVELTITDTLGLQNRFTLKVRVSTTPNFSGLISQYQDTICIGMSSTLVGGIAQDSITSFGVLPVESSFIGGGFLAGQTFLPDGSGVSYQTTIVLDEFPVGTTVENPTDILAVCATMEHSFLGDLSITLTCPDGTEITLQNQGGGSCNLGVPWATAVVDGESSNTTPGEGYEYCWTADATQSLEEGCVGGIEFVSGDGPGTYTDTQVPAGNYLPDESLDGLIGCPINGEWTITVTDHLGADNGYIFSWGIQFDPEIDPTVETYQPQLIDGFWSDAPTIISNNDTIIVVSPTEPGDYAYTFNVLDNFGCTYDTTVNLTVTPFFSIDAINPGCNLESELTVNNSYQGGQWTAELPSPTSPYPFLPSGSGEALAFEPGYYTLTYNDFFCQAEEAVEVYFPPVPIAEITPMDSVYYCIGFDETLLASDQVLNLPVNYVWSMDSLGFTIPFSFNNTASIGSPGVVTLTVTDDICQEVAIDQILAIPEICDITPFNVFTPNGDDENDVFYIGGIEKFRNPVVFVYNRWGNLIFERENYRNDWDMEGLPDGTYYYVIQNPQNNESFKGYFTVMR